MYIDFNIENQTLRRIDNNLLAANSQNLVKARFFFDSLWNDLNKKAVFEYNNTAYKIALTDNECIVPCDVLKEGAFSIGVIATDNNTEKMLRATSNTLLIEVKKGPSLTADNITEPLPSEIERIEAIAQSVRNDADSGMFNSTVSIGEVNSLPASDIPYVTNVGTENNAILDFGIPKGKDGESIHAVTDVAELRELCFAAASSPLKCLWIGTKASVTLQAGDTVSFSPGGFYKVVFVKASSNVIFRNVIFTSSLASGEGSGSGEDGIGISNAEINENGHLIITLTNNEKIDAGKVKGEDGYTPEKVSELINDVGYISKETDPTVPSWAKQSTKPAYSAAEVGADASGTAASKVAEHNTKSDAHNDIRLSISNLSALIAAISVPSKLSELSDDSTHRLVSDTEKAAWNNKSDFSGKYSELTGKPTNVSAFTNDAGYLTSFTEADPTVPSWAKAASKPSYTKSEVGLSNVDNVKQYSVNNPPPYPVTSVNGKTGAVTITVPTKTSELTNNSGFLTSHQDISGKADKSSAETWTFTLKSGSTVTKKVVLA